MTKKKEKNISNREVKDSAFTTFFGEPENASKLYAALGEMEVSPEDIAYVTLEGVLFIARKNDLAFTVKNRILVISEHQSTINENMPLRLSDAYLEKTEHPMLELEVKVININPSSGHRLLKECRPMYEYSWFIQQIKDYLADGWSRDDAITQAVQDCLDNGIMTEFMREHGSEAVNMLYTQWNWDDAMEVEREEAYEDGVEAGKIVGKAEGIAEGKSLGDIIRSRQDILDLLEDLGDIPKDIQSRIDAEKDVQILRQWHKAAAKAVSFDAFREKME